VDWCSIAGAETVVITIAHAVMRELNDHKDNPRSRKLRDRADAAIKELHARYKGQKPKQLRASVEIQFLAKDPTIDFVSYGLLRELPDDWLIATAIELAAQNSEDTVAIVTADFGMEVKASSLLRVIQMPDSLRLPEELNSDEKKIKELEQKIRSIEDASPDLRLAFADGAIFQELRFFDYPAPDRTAATRMQEAREKYPKTQERASSNVLGIDLSLLSNPFIQAYNERIDAYLEKLDRFWNRMKEVADWYNETAKVQLYVTNQGGAPAEDVDISVHFPDGFEVLGEDGLPQIPKQPPPPVSIEDAVKSMTNPPLLYQPSFASMNSLIPKAQGNSRLLDIKKTKSHTVKFHVSKLKHQSDEKVPALYLHFSDPPKSFRADYRLIAGNVPTPIVGTLGFVWKPKAAKE
jgi:hypothetical protein